LYVRQQTKHESRFLLKSFGAKEVNELVVTSNKLTNFADLITRDLGPDVARGPPAEPR